jgi:hypothetical protein
MMATSLAADAVAPAVTVSLVSLPPDARALSTLSRIDYADAFIVDAGVERTPEQWIKATLEDAPLATRASLVSGWTALGLELGTQRSERHVLGWTVQRSDAEVLLLHAGSRLGLEGQLLVRSSRGGLLFATLVQLDNAAVRAVWARITARHQRVVGSLLTHAARRELRREYGEPAAAT